MSRIRSTLRKLRPVYESLFRGLARLPGNPVLRIQSKRCGLFGDIAITLNAIRFAERSGLDCQVDWGKRSLYFDPDVGDKVWEYLFERSQFSFAGDHGGPSYGLPYYESAFKFPPYEGMSERDSLARAIREWCRPKPGVQELVDAHLSAHFATANLGVHYRGTDAVAGFEDRSIATLDKIEHKIVEWLDSNPGGKVFLASDDAIAVAQLAARFPDRLHHRECLRSSDGNSLHGHYDAGQRSSGFTKATEVLVDALLLSNCDLLLHCESRVAWFARAKNPQLPEIVLK